MVCGKVEKNPKPSQDEKSNRQSSPHKTGTSKGNIVSSRVIYLFIMIYHYTHQSVDDIW